MARYGIALTLLVAALAVGSRTGSAEEKPAVAWGTPRDGLQVGFYFVLPKSTYRVGERVAFHLMIKNVAEQPVTLRLKKTSSWLATLTADSSIRLHPMQGDVEMTTLKPGDERAAPGDAATFLLQPWDAAGKFTEPILRLPAGKYRLNCPMSLWIADEKDPNRATGVRARPGDLTLEVMPEADQVAGPVVDEALVKENNASVSWGKPVNGLQHGLRFKAEGLQRIKHGESVEWEIVARNVSRSPLTFTCLKFEQGWDGNTPSVTNEKGDYVEVKMVFTTGLRRTTTLTLKPGEVVVLGSPAIGVESPAANFQVETTPRIAVPAGKYRVSQYESARPDGSTLFDLLIESGSLEFEVVP